jgi:cytochrome c oxidase cbb3-type subunit 3
MTDDHKKEIDLHSGVETTGHEWDGLKELNNPAPRWWLWVFYLCVLWSVAYWILYPAWPTLSGATKGTLNTNQYKALESSKAEITARQNIWLDKFRAASYDDIIADPELYQFAMAGGAASFKDNCATCHGTGAAGGAGIPKPQ